MTRLFTFLILVTCFQFTPAQILLQEDFSSNIMPPTGWNIDKYDTNWRIEQTNMAGGTRPECILWPLPAFNDTSRLISPVINTTGSTMLYLKFKNWIYYFEYSTPYTIGVATRSQGHPWSIVWSEIEHTKGTFVGEKYIFINNPDVGKPDFQFCIFFQGNTNEVEWSFDDIILGRSPTDEVGITKILGTQIQYEPGSFYTPRATVKNFGINSESFNVQCNISDVNGKILYQNTQNVSNLFSKEVRDISFTPYTLGENCLYKIEITSQLNTDTNLSNNTLFTYLNTWTTVKNLILLEIMTNITCPNCPYAQLGAMDLINNGKKVAVVEYHGDQVFRTAALKNRLDYFYAFPGFPFAVFDGTLSQTGGYNHSNYDLYLPLYDSEYTVKTPLDVSIYGKATGNNSFNLAINIWKLAPFINSNTYLYVALTESPISFNWEDQTEVDFVERAMLPLDIGTHVDLSGQTKITVPLILTTQPSWVYENLELVAWVQDPTTKEVYNTAKVKLSELQEVSVKDENLPVSKYSISQNYPNPFNPSTTIEYSVPETGRVVIKLYNITGKEETTLVDAVKEPGVYKLDFTAGRLSSGIYFCRMTGKNFVHTIKMSIVK
ncbi:MAG: T9SS type A sorting domain-containing protein [Ignavibacteriaceae bacterium]|nr:T9SS type A sorting domain-containing protein [Ignavibacteriaceae bacterium]